jgi:hypothetical protein
MGVWKLERHGAVAVLTFNRPHLSIPTLLPAANSRMLFR